MAGDVHVLGIRHHGPGSARTLLRALSDLNPDAVLIEGPADAADVLPIAASDAMKPPVALLVYVPDQPAESVYYPFATFSPEWQAIRWGLAAGKAVRFIDLPSAQRPNRKPEPTPDSTMAETEQVGAAGALPPRRDPLDELAAAAGLTDGEAWWGRLIEERRGDAHPLQVFDAIRETMAAARQALGDPPRDADEPFREAHMRRAIRAALKDGFETIVVVCGAWHAPVLTAEALKQFTAKADDELLKGLARSKTTATWIPWTYDRLAVDSGYAAGIRSPGWYEHLWLHPENLSERWMTRVARLMRDEDLDASPAGVIESVRLADSLAALRGRSLAGLEELGEATLSVLCHGNLAPMRVIERRLIVGHQLGEVPEDVPTVPLQRDLAAQQKSLRMKVSANDNLLDLDQRKENDLARSRLLHRLNLLNIPWGKLQDNQMQRASTFHEIWTLQWRPEFAVAVMEAARWGNTVETAAEAFVGHRADTAAALGDLTDMLDHVMLADLHGGVERLVGRIQALSAVSADAAHLMEALPSLVRVLRYGNVRKADTALVEPVVSGLFARICVGLLPACGSLDDDAAAAMRRRMDDLHAALTTLNRTEYLESWKVELRKVGDADIHGLVSGRAWRHLFDTSAATSDAVATRLSLALSKGNDPAKASAWLEGFLAGSGMVLVHDDRLLGIVDAWVVSLPRDLFESVCPIVRRTFSTFDKPERRQIGERLKRGVSIPAAEEDGDDYDTQRGALVEPVLRLILGDAYP